jgi:hypothetical protein
MVDAIAMVVVVVVVDAIAMMDAIAMVVVAAVMAAALITSPPCPPGFRPLSRCHGAYVARCGLHPGYVQATTRSLDANRTTANG